MRFRILGMVLTIALVMVFLLSSSVFAAGEKIVIGVLTSTFSDKWLSYLHDAMRQKAEELGVELVMTDGRDDVATQLANLENLIARRVDAIVACMVDVTAAQPFVQRCREAGIPLVGVNRPFEGCDVYIGGDSLQSGVVQMEEVAWMLNYRGKIGILMGVLGHEAQIKRTQGNEMVVAKYPDMEIVVKDTGNWDRAKGMEIAENWIQSGIELDAIVSNNDEMAIGAIRALEAAGKLDKVIVAGIDATPDALKYVKEGKLKVTVFQDPFKQGGGAVEAAVKLVRGEPVESKLIPYELVTAKNVDQYIKLWADAGWTIE
ncbi:MAG: inositol transport system substrate-binding protein [Candidatus Atribacteria bacterium]|jgi:inositol transport system substrate-binding protein|nr:inositol transport system substrate-binding protein [Candidatus Atribacteria bacterium]